MKLVSMIVMLIGILVLSACSEPNPLQQKPRDESAQLLVQHSAKASIAMGLKTSDASDNYRQCMEGQHPDKTCQALYQAMSRSFHLTGMDISPQQVSDKALYKKLASRLSRLSLLMED